MNGREVTADDVVYSWIRASGDPRNVWYIAPTTPEKDRWKIEALDKYTKRSPTMSVEDQAQVWRYLGDVLCSASGGIHNIGAYHGGGSPVMEQIAITTQFDIDARKKLVRHLAGMSGGDRDALAKQSKGADRTIPAAQKTKTIEKTPARR
jgi:hypothetical protein